MADEEAQLTTTTTWLNGFLSAQDHDDEDLTLGEFLHEECPLQVSNYSPFKTSITHFLLSSTLPHEPKSVSSLQATTRVGLFDNHKGMINCNKYTLKLHNGIASAADDDGYKWRKYGQKSIKNSPFPRSYYKCTNKNCSAKKQVEKSREEADTLIVTYEGLHLHFSYPYFPLTTTPDAAGESPPPSKKHRTESYNDTNKKEEGTGTESSSACSSAPDHADSNCESYSDGIMGMRDDDAPQGLLEDLVPLLIRNPALAGGRLPSSTSSPCSSHLSSSVVSSLSSEYSFSLEFN